MCLCMCVCEREREGAREREGERERERARKSRGRGQKGKKENLFFSLLLVFSLSSPSVNRLSVPRAGEEKRKLKED